MLLRTALAAFVISAALTSHASNFPPLPLREFRAGWVPSVGNSQWPSKRGLTTAEQKAELIAILDRAKEIKLNAIILQVRPACDALYVSKIEPWSEYLTGQMGQAPSPFYDPLAFAVAEAHQRGLELHAWVNPFRARVLASQSSISAQHVSKKNPGMVIQYGKYLWLDPGQKAVQNYSLNVIMDIVRRYDIDGLHMDDYFYPYVERDEAKQSIPFRDGASWQKYQAAGGKLSRGDWRRENVNAFIERTYRSIKAQKNWVKFGVSPFGIWKPGYPVTTSLKSGNMYEEIYCDSLKWWTNGWMDYLAPQLYWAIAPPDQSYTALLKWWAEHNTQRRHLWAGMNTANTGGKWKAEEIVNQVKATRAQRGATGHIHWSMKSVMRNSGGVADKLKPLYEEPALVPASPWLNSSVPPKPSLAAKQQKDGFNLQWSSAGEKPFAWVLQQQIGEEWRTAILPVRQSAAQISRDSSGVAISAINRYGMQSPPTILELNNYP